MPQKQRRSPSTTSLDCWTGLQIRRKLRPGRNELLLCETMRKPPRSGSATKRPYADRLHCQFLHLFHPKGLLSVIRLYDDTGIVTDRVTSCFNASSAAASVFSIS